MYIHNMYESHVMYIYLIKIHNLFVLNNLYTMEHILFWSPRISLLT
jgi:hypothetical protein